jgi:hypothetical protein
MKKENRSLKANKMLKKLFLTVAASISLGISAQTTETEPCGYDQVIEMLEQKYPGFKENYDRQYREMLATPQVSSRKINVKDTQYFHDTVFTIPIVFHILYNVAAENIHDSLIYNQLEVLNADFRRLNADTTKTRSVFKSRAGDTRIQFVLASTDPLGNSTTGILRKATAKSSFYPALQGLMKYSSDGGDDAWDPQKYLNIWVCDMSYQNTPNVLGFAYPPYGHPFWPQTEWVSDPNQGVVLHYQIVGRNNPMAVGGVLGTSNKGRVATHEVGHFLGLRHIWGDGSTSCGEDDYIYDTPRQAFRSNFDCNLSLNSCTDPGVQYPDMVENYMDYSAHTCQNMFTNQQIGVMHTALSKYRTALPSSMEITTTMKVIDTVEYDQLKIYASQGQKVIVEVRNDDLKENMIMDVLDMTGQAVLRDISINKNEHWVNTSNLASGVYFFHLKKMDGKSVKIEKLLLLKN